MTRRTLLPLLAAALAAAAGVACASPGKEPFGLMPMDEVERLLARKEIAVFDANVPEIWERSHLPGAVSVVGRDLAQVLPADRNAKVVFYCTGPK